MANPEVENHTPQPPDLAALILAYEQAVSTNIWGMSEAERKADAVKVEAAYKAMVAAAKAAQ